MYHFFALPFPFPIRAPIGFLVSGKNGKALNQQNRCVLSIFLTARFKKSLNLEICDDVNRNGRKTKRPLVPIFNRGLILNILIRRILCSFLNLKVLGLKISFTLIMNVINKKIIKYHQK